MPDEARRHISVFLNDREKRLITEAREKTDGESQSAFIRAATMSRVRRVLGKRRVATELEQTDAQK